MIDRRIRSGEFPLRAIAFVWLALCGLLLAVSAADIAAANFPDPDDALRLVQVRDLLAGQGWYDLHQYRVDPPQGTWMHWSRLVDIPLAGLILLLSPIFGQPLAETIALVAVPLLTMGIMIVFVGRLAWRLLGREAAIMACLCAGLMPLLVFQLQPMRIDHHGWQIVAVAAALFAISGRDPIKGGAGAGIAMAAGLMISIELLPMSAAFGFVLALRWLRDRQDRLWLVSFLKALAAGLCVAFLVGRGSSDLAPWCDAISPAHLGFFIVVALGTGAVALLPPMPRPALVGFLGLAGLAGLGFFGWSSPACLASPFGTLDPLVREYWYVNVLEGQPLWQQKPDLALPVLLQVIVALGATIALYLRSYDWLRRWWFDYAILLGLAILAGVLTWRSMAFASVISLVPLGWLMACLLASMRSAIKPRRKYAIAAAMILVLLPTGPVSAVQALLPGSGAVASQAVSRSACEISANAPRLDRLGQGRTIFAPLDIGPSILLGSHQGVVATGHHRANAAMADVIRAFISSPEDARSIVAAHKAGYVAMCTDLVEVQIYAGAAPDGLAARLAEGNSPAWLEPVEMGGPEPFAVWRVKP